MSFLRSFLLGLGHHGAVDLAGHLFECTDGAGSQTNPLAVDHDGLQVDVLAALGSDVGVAARVRRVGAFPGQEADT